MHASIFYMNIKLQSVERCSHCYLLTYLLTCVVGCVVRQACSTVVRLARSADVGPPCPQSHVAATPTSTQRLHDCHHSSVRARPSRHAAALYPDRVQLCADTAAWPAAERESDEGMAVDGRQNVDKLTNGHCELRVSTLQSPALHATCLRGSLRVVVVLSARTNLVRIHSQGLHQQTV